MQAHKSNKHSWKERRFNPKNQGKTANHAKTFATHITPHTDSRSDLRPTASKFVTVEDGTQIPILGVGNIKLRGLQLDQVYFVSQLRKNPISLRKLIEKGYKIHFQQEQAKIIKDSATTTLQQDDSCLYCYHADTHIDICR